jgi:hypothetical protein
MGPRRGGWVQLADWQALGGLACHNAHLFPLYLTSCLHPSPAHTDPTYRLPNSANLPKRYTPQAAFRFALPGPQVRLAAAAFIPST